MGYIGMIGGIIYLCVTCNLFSSSPLVIVLQAGAFLLVIWARLAFGRRSFHVVANPTEGGLVTSGPYRYIRHPIYAAICLIAWSGIAANFSVDSALCGGLILTGALMRIYSEETLVAERYPEYSQYKTKTWRMLPFVY
jgi:Putative protein-S-isoprenylcysteine methyltransferase